jgi:MFS transporter, DHA1 family, tetracycline resistance protein
MDKLTKRALPAALFTVFLDAVGVAILIPIYIALVLPGPLQVIPPDWTIREGYIMVGWLAGIYSLFTFLAAPLLGQLSDKYGRKRVLAISLFGTSVGYAMFAVGVLTKNIPLMFASRAIDGLTGGNIAVARAIISDISTPQNRTKNFGLVGAMFGMGFVLGPYIGGRLSSPGAPFINFLGHQFLNAPSWFTTSTPFWFATILAFINTLLALFVLPETLKKVSNDKLHWAQSFINVKKAFTMPMVRNVLPISFLFSVGFTFFTSFFGFTMVKNIPGFKPANVADYFSLIGIWIAVFQGVLVMALAKKYRNYQILRFSLFGVAASVLVILAVRTTPQAILVSPLIPLFVAMTMANMISLVSNIAGPKSQGEVMGVNSSVEALGQGIPQVLSGYVASVAVWLPSVVAATTMIIAGLLFWYMVKPSMIPSESADSLH